MAILRVHLMQNEFGYRDPAMEQALYETTILHQFLEGHAVVLLLGSVRNPLKCLDV